ncbi:MAG: Crp/Fnr family transcriptional regulator [Bdellovibrionales bacterium]|nr:Crp/Fnr family transcriptional regulator [Bdellovibrionales bacterium]
MGARELNLKPQDVLFEEGDQSKNLYFVKQGMIRIFKRKAEGNIEIDTVRAGQILGELAFFDDQPRSASCEALTSVTVIEISKTALDDAMAKLPEWFVSLTKTITSRLRTANNRIRLLESLSTEYETDKHGNRSREYVFVNTAELLRFCTAALTVAARYGKPLGADSAQFEFSVGMLERFAGILQVPASKIISLIELFKKVEIFKDDLVLTDIKFLDQMIQFLNEQNILEPSKKRTLSELGFQALSALVKARPGAVPVNDKSQKVNMAAPLRAAKLQPSALQELYDHHFVASIMIVSSEEIWAEYEPIKNTFDYRTFWLLNELGKLNEQKRQK